VEYLKFFFSAVISKEDLLFKKLLDARSGTLARPIQNVSDVVSINVTAYLLQILDLVCSLSLYFCWAFS
jgi:hypothetical protein